MNLRHQNDGWESWLRAGLGEPPAPDFAAWRARDENARRLGCAGGGSFFPIVANPQDSHAPFELDRGGAARRVLSLSCFAPPELPAN